MFLEALLEFVANAAELVESLLHLDLRRYNRRRVSDDEG